MALQGAAGVAMHLGVAEQAYQLAEQVLERHHESGTADNEALVLVALSHCQNGRIDEGLAVIEDVDVSDFPFGQGARAVVRAVAGELDRALEDAQSVEQARGASYFDVALARLGAVLAASGSGDTPLRNEWLDRFTTLANSVGDVVLIDLAHELAGREAEPESSDRSPGAGWRRMIAEAAAA
jgi:hypothetical protein